MAANQFLPTSTVGWVDGFPNSPVRFEDIQVSNILLALVKTWVNPDTQENVEVFQLEVLEGGGQVTNLHRTTYLFTTWGTLADLKAFIDAEAAGNNLTTYTDLFAIDEADKVIATRDVLVNDSLIVRRVYDSAADHTVLYCQANEWRYKKLFVDGDQGKGKTYYDEVYG